MSSRALSLIRARTREPPAANSSADQAGGGPPRTRPYRKSSIWVAADTGHG